MTGYPHPKGPEQGRVYATPADAIEAGEAGMILSLEALRHSMADPRAAELLEEAEAAADDAMTLEEYTERFGRPGSTA